LLASSRAPLRFRDDLIARLDLTVPAVAVEQELRAFGDAQ
jgi:hypothetical protein